VRLPALWIAAACAAGIEASRLAGLSPAKCAAAAIVAVFAAAFLLWRSQTAAAWALTLLAWAAIGSTAASLQRSLIAPDNVAQLIAQGRIDVSSPLRWQGRLRNDPVDRPWGEEYLVDLDRVEIAGTAQPVSGGLRLTLYGDANNLGSAGEFRAGDRVEALVKAQPPRNFNDPGAFDARAYLASQEIHLTGSLRNAALLTLIDRPAPGLRQKLARVHGALLKRIDGLFAGQPESEALLRAMLLGDRSFVDTATAVAFQRTAAFHVLVVAGLHTGAIVLFVLWLCRRLRIGVWPTIFITLFVLTAYVGVVEDRPPILRASLMAALYLLARSFFRRADLLNTVAIVALGLLLWDPAFVSDSSF
jgi:competence protein ComEC